MATHRKPGPKPRAAGERYVVVAVKVPPALVPRIRTAAEADGRAVSAWCRRTIEAALR